MRYSPTAKRLVTVTPPRSASASSRKGSRRVAWKMLQSMDSTDRDRTSPGLRHRTSRSSLRDSRAKISVLRAARWVFSATHDQVCGDKLCDWQERASLLNGSSSKTLLQSSHCKKRASQWSSGTFMKQGILFDGQLYRAEMLVPVTAVKDGGRCATARLATPRTCDYNRPMTYTTLCQNVCMSSYEDVMSRHDREVLLGHLNCHLSESIMGFPLDWTKTTDSDVL